MNEIPRAPLNLLAGRFRPLHVLKSEGGLETALARDENAGRDVVIKSAPLQDVPIGVRLRLEHESRVLGHAPLPLAPILHVASEGGRFFVVSPYVPGRALEQTLAFRRLSIDEAIRVVRAVLEALRGAHLHHVIHHDVRPSNVIIPDLDNFEQTTLIDFGLRRTVLSEGPTHNDLGRSVCYMSPEQSGLLDHEVDERSDLYAVGLLLFECLTGKRYVEGRSLHEVLRSHLTHPPPDLRMVGIAAPRALNEVLKRLLHKDPRERYQTAAAVLADLDEISTALARGESDPQLVIGRHDQRTVLTEPAFVGREIELVGLEAAVEQARRGEGGLAILETESGGGKTRLLDELGSRCAERSWVLRGGGLDQSAQSPLQLLTGVVAGMAARLDAEPLFAKALRERLGAQAGVIAGVLPRLAALLGIEGVPREQGREEHGEVRTLQALSAFLDALGDADRPALVLLDDCQWADEIGLRLLDQWKRLGGPRHVLVVVAFRSEEVGPDHPLRHIGHTKGHWVLPPLGVAEAERLMLSVAGPLPREALDSVFRLSEGNPFMVSAVLHGLIESQGLVRQGEGWRVQADKVPELQSSRRAAAFLTHRFELLPAPALRLATIGAILGKEFDLDFAIALSGETPATAIACLEEARRRHMLWTRRDGSAYVFVHDKLREALLERLGVEERREHHLRAAKLFEARAPDRIFELAYHYDAAGAPDRALRYALAAAAQARAQHSLEIAERQYRIADRAVVDKQTRRKIAEGLGDVLLLRGKYEEAAPQLLLARSLCEDAFARSQLQLKLGELAFKRGDVAEASRVLAEGLELLGKRPPPSSVALVLLTFWELLVQVAHSLLPSWFVGRRRLEGTAEEFQAIRFYSRLAYAYWFQRGRLACAWAHLREMNLAERYPPTPELAQAYSEHAPVATMVPLFKRSLAYAGRSLAIRKELGDLWGEGQSHHFHGVALYAASRYAECIERCEEAVRLLERTGDRWEVNTARWNIAFSLYRQGDLRRAVEQAHIVYRAGLEIGDHQATGISLGVWAKAARGRIPRELIHRELERRKDDVHTSAEILQAEAVRLLAEQLPSEARVVLEEADRLVESAGVRQEYVAPVKPWLATAQRCELESTPAWPPALRRARLRAFQRTARKALRLARHYQNNLPHALRETGWSFALAGRPVMARRLLDESLVVAVAQHAVLEQRLTEEARGTIGESYGWPGAREERLTAQLLLQQLDSTVDGNLLGKDTQRPPTVSLADRFSTVLRVGRSIGSALSEEAVCNAAREAALALLRADHCALARVIAHPRVQLVPMDGGDGQVPLGLGHRSVRLGKPVIVSEGSAAPDDGLSAGVRSAVCVPILLRGEPMAVLYAGHRQVDGLFGKEEEQLSAFIAALAGAAFENAAGFLQISEAVRVRDEFLSVASHELRTPLTSVRLLVDQATRLVGNEGGAGGKVGNLLARTHHATTRLVRLVDQLLDVSRITSGRLEMEPVETNLSTLVADVAARFQDECKRAGSDLAVEIAPAVTGVWDPLRLDQIVTNLLGNAVKYGRGRPIGLLLEGGAENARLTVSDKGIGIQPEDLHRIFGRFERVVSARHYGGFGLGLWIVQQLVTAHGGTIQVDSKAGEGSVFTVDLPRDRARKGTFGMNVRAASGGQRNTGSAP